MLNNTIIEYFLEQNVFVLSTSENNSPYSSICFYAYHVADNSLVFLSSSATRHIKEGLNNATVSGAITGQNINVTQLKGIQFTGKLIHPKGDKLENYKACYLKKHPVARFMNAECWVIKLNFIKMTNNTLGFGKKLIWEQ